MATMIEPRQLGFDHLLYSPMEKRLAYEQLLYHKPINIVRQFFEFYMLIRPQEPIRITPRFPNGWIAEVVSEDKVWTVECYRGEIKLVKVADLVGHAANGGFIVAAEEPAEMWNEYQQPCNYGGASDNSLLCIDFCRDEDDGCDFRCRCCPSIRRSFDD